MRQINLMLLCLCAPITVWAAPMALNECGEKSSIDTSNAAQSAENLQNYFTRAAADWAKLAKDTATHPLKRKTLEDCTSDLRKALAEAAKPAVARAGGTGLLETVANLRQTVDSLSNEVTGTLPVQMLTDLGLQRIAQEQKIDPGAARYDFYLGPTYALSPTGSWNGGVEILFRSNTNRLFERQVDAGSRYFQISSLFAYRTLGGDDVNLDSDTPNAGGENEGFVSPFEADGGIASVDLRLAYFAETKDLKSAYGLAALAGAESLPLEKDEGAFTTLKPRAGLGGLFRTSYGDGALGELFLGYIRDSRYEARLTGEDEDSKNRLAMSGILQLPSFSKGGALRMAARIFASTPVSGGDASELRLSVLVAYDLRTLVNQLP